MEINIPIDFHIFQRGGLTTNQIVDLPVPGHFRGLPVTGGVIFEKHVLEIFHRTPKGMFMIDK